MLNNKTAKIFIIIGATFIVLIFVLWQYFLVSSWTKSEAIADGVKIGGYDVGSYSLETAKKLLETNLENELYEKSIDISYNDITSSVIIGNFARYKFESALEEAISIARSGNAITDYLALLKANLFGISLDFDLSFDEAALENELLNISGYYFIQSQNAYITSFNPDAEQGQRISIEPQIKGQKLDIEKTIQSIEDSIISGKSEATAYIVETDADITSEILNTLDCEPVTSEYTISSISVEYESAIYQVVSSGRHEILLPGQEISVIEFMGAEDYIYFEMPDGVTDSDYEKALAEFYPTQIYLAAIMSELEITERKTNNFYAPNLPAGTSSITNLYYDMNIKNPLPYPVIIRVGYKKQGLAGIIYCEVYRPVLENKTLVRSIIKQKENKTLVDITRVYVDNIGNTVDSIVIDTVEVAND